MGHEKLEELLNNLEKETPGTPEWHQANTKVNQYFAMSVLFDDTAIPNHYLWRTYRLSVKQHGCLPTIKKIVLGIRIALFS